MIEETKQFKEELKGISSYRKRNDYIKEASPYKGKRCYVISCGPTLMKFDFDKIREKLKDEMVVCIKQSFDQFKDICDVHIYNCANVKTYDYANTDTVIVESTSFGRQLNKKCHLKYHILERRLEGSVSGTKEFDKWTLDNVYERPYGPGIMYETVFYMLKQLGVSEIVTLGWDNSLTTRKNVHFYDAITGSRSKFVEENDQKTAVNWEALTIEEQFTINVMGDWYNWLKDSGIQLTIISDTNPAPEYVPRLGYDHINGE